MLSSVLSKSVVDRGRATAIATVLVVFYGGIAIVSYNALGNTMVELLANMPPALAALYGSNDGTPLGMAIGAIYSLIAPAVVLTYAIGGGTGAAIGEEMRGSMDLLLANPLSRPRVILSKFAVVLGGIVVLTAGTALGVFGATLLTGNDMGGRNVLALSVMLVAFGWMFGSFAMALSGWVGRSSVGTGVAAAVAGVSWLVTTILAVDKTFATIARYTPWYLYDGNDPMTNGIAPWSLLVMLVATVVLTGLAVFGVSRRDLKG
ncbi:MAG: ABC transporter permease subunit [Acidimicrobiia bacterium]|nr:ABC transporter permease subunit [Acidimicrobiia bacterium]